MQVQLSLICMLALAANATQLEVTPVAKVLQLMQGMLEKGKQEKHAEQVVFAAEKQNCDDTKAVKKVAIKEKGQKIDGLQADIKKDAADIARLTKEIAGHSKDSDTWTGDKKAATKVRNIEKDDYMTLHKDYSESIDALGRAIAVMKKQTFDRKQQKESLVQVSSLQKMSLIPEDAKRMINSFVQEDDAADALDEAAPEANGYEFQSNGVIDMLTKLHSKFIDERTSIEKQEANSKNAYSLLMQDLSSEIEQSNKDTSSKTVFKTKTATHKADATGDEKDTQELKAGDEKFLSDLTSTCSTKASDFQSRQELRTSEIQTIEKAIGIISGSAVKGSAAAHLPGLLQKSTALPQLRSNLQTQMQMRVSQYLEGRAATLNSRVLAAVASRVTADPFSKVKKMVKDMVVKLMEQANSEADHKGFCDTELSTNAQTRKEKTDNVASLNADIEMLTASITKNTNEKTKLSEEVSELDAEMASDTKERNEEKTTNAATVKDAQEAQTAIAQALTVLKEFYASAAEATSFIQNKAPYNGMQDENGGVLAMLEVIASDFARLESETNAAEATAQKEYDTGMTEAKTLKAEKSAAIEHKTEKLQDQSQALVLAQADLEGTQKALDAALEEYDKLKPACVDSGVSYEDRVQKRKEEIESLQESLKLMDSA